MQVFVQSPACVCTFSLFGRQISCRTKWGKTISSFFHDDSIALLTILRFKRSSLFHELSNRRFLEFHKKKSNEKIPSVSWVLTRSQSSEKVEAMHKILGRCTIAKKWCRMSTKCNTDAWYCELMVIKIAFSSNLLTANVIRTISNWSYVGFN